VAENPGGAAVNPREDFRCSMIAVNYFIGIISPI
jgi:hypothetical protein